MRRNIIILVYLALFLQTNLFAQMQGIVNSSERELSTFQPYVNTVKVEKYSDNIILTLCKDVNSGYFYFIKTETGSSNVTYSELSRNFNVYDFKVFGEYIYFCGQNSNNTYGFIAKISFSNLFSGGNFDYYEIQPTKIVYELEVYNNKTTESNDIVALGTDNAGTYFCINYNTNATTMYDIYPTQTHVLQSVTQTDNFIGVVFSDPLTNEFGVMRHLKNNIPTIQSQTWRFAYLGHKWIDLKPENRTYAYLSEAIDETDEILVVTSVDYDDSNPNVPAYYDRTVNIYRIDLSTLQLQTTQVILTEGKPYIKDMVYAPYNKSLNIITNVQIGDNVSGFPYCCEADIDIIYQIDVDAITPYNASYVIPYNSIAFTELINSITKYDNGYYIVAGKSNTSNQLYWFDRFLPNNNPSCYAEWTTKVFFDPDVPLGTINYNPISILKIESISKVSTSSSKYIETCP